MRNVILTAGFIAAIALNIAPWPTGDLAYLATRQLRYDVLCMIPFTIIIAALAAGPTLLSPILALRPSVFLGDISYGVYIYHWIPWTVVAIAIDRRVPVSNSQLVIVIFATIIFAAASYIGYERPMRLYLRRKLGP